MPGEWEINPTLLHLLKTEYGVDLDQAELADLLDQDARSRPNRLCCSSGSRRPAPRCRLPVKPRVVLGNFSYAKLPMVLDLETADRHLARLRADLRDRG